VPLRSLRDWTPYATAAVCQQCGTLDLQLASAGEVVIPDRRMLTPEEELLADLALGAQTGALEEAAEELLAREDLTGEGRGWLQRFRKHITKASGIEDIVRLRTVLDGALAEAQALDDGVVEGEIISESWDDEPEAISGAPPAGPGEGCRCM
jgi:hypothetical protein